MAKTVYRQYKNRLIEISGSNKCLCLSRIAKRSAYDVGRLLEGRSDKIAAFNDHFFSMERTPFPLICKEEENAITSAIGGRATMTRRVEGLPAEKTVTTHRTPAGEIADLRALMKEVTEIEKETGRYELYVGYPFVFGEIHSGTSKTLVKAPLLLFPVRVEFPDEETAVLRILPGRKAELNRALIFAYAQSKNLNVDGMELEFDDPSRFKDVKKLLAYLATFGVRFECQDTSRNVFPFERYKDPNGKGRPTVRRAAVLARFPLSSSIYNDYTILEKCKATPNALTELITPAKCKNPAKKSRPGDDVTYPVKMLDYAQSEVVRAVAKHGNTVIWGPPGTGKSQTIVSVITDAICKNKRILVVSQKKAALDVVYNRLGDLSGKAMYIVDETKEKQSFYERCLDAHQKRMIESLADVEALSAEYRALEARIAEDTATLQAIDEVQNRTRPFGLSLSEMYAASTAVPKNSPDYAIYTRMLENPRLMAMDYPRFDAALLIVRSKDFARQFFDFAVESDKNPFLACVRPDADMVTVRDTAGSLETLLKTRKTRFKSEKYPLWRKAVPYLFSLGDPKNLAAVAAAEAKIAHPDVLFRGGARKQYRGELQKTVEAISEYAERYDFLRAVLTDDGYLFLLTDLLAGNGTSLRQIAEILTDYVAVRDRKKLVSGLDEDTLAILEFALAEAKNFKDYLAVIEKILPIRIYHEVIRYEDEDKDILAKTADFANITSRIETLKERELEVATRLCAGKNSRAYDDLYANAKNNKDYLYQISKKQNFWPIRKTMEEYGEFVLSLFPCWLLSPECVSGLLPLERDLFDLVIFDEASQVFIESSVPAIWRGKNIVVAGDPKQLRPSATFMKRYMGADPEEETDYSVRAALEVESLLDLAVARYASANLTYHYRSRASELIDFSNYAFYSGSLQVAPNVTRNRKSPPIERVKVDGRWIDRKNEAEAEKIAGLVAKILKTRKGGESIGVITFNSDQQACILDKLEKAAAKDPAFRTLLARESDRRENGEDVSLFVKNLENVQGDERDIIIFSIGYAPNAEGKIYTNFGSLSTEGGENRLNVAVTRAKSRVIVVTSVEPEDLKVDGAKNAGPGLLRKYLEYVRAVSDGDRDATENLLLGLCPSEERKAERSVPYSDVAGAIRDKLERSGFTVDLGLGNRKSRISLAVYDPALDRYLVGVVLDSDAAAASESLLERDVFLPRFLSSRGWNLVRVYRRDFWHNPGKVVNLIRQAAVKEREKILSERKKA